MYNSLSYKDDLIIAHIRRHLIVFYILPLFLWILIYKAFKICTLKIFLSFWTKFRTLISNFNSLVWSHKISFIFDKNHLLLMLIILLMVVVFCLKSSMLLICTPFVLFTAACIFITKYIKRKRKNIALQKAIVFHFYLSLVLLSYLVFNHFGCKH